MLSISRTRVRQRGALRIWVATPFIYAMVVPIAFLDASVSLYQGVCFWAYGIPYVKRRTHVRLQWRGKGVIKPLDRFHCMYCGYANGVIAYTRAIAIETEKYWCPIKYQARQGFVPPHSQVAFIESIDREKLASFIERVDNANGS